VTFKRKNEDAKEIRMSPENEQGMNYMEGEINKSNPECFEVTKRPWFISAWDTDFPLRTQICALSHFNVF